MAYNKARAEIEWLKNKKKEEAELRCLGFCEESITKLRAEDWEMFKSSRRYYERINNTETYENRPVDETPPEIRSVQDLLDNIDDQRLYQALLTVDKITLQIAVYKINGYSSHEIADILKLTDKAVYRRLDRLKEKMKKLF
jgi:DNA-directed RNA polymerase specialized sigma24 family protein